MERRFVRPCPRMREHEELLKFRQERPQTDSLPERIDGEGYSVRFIEKVPGGYLVNLFRDDGTPVGLGVRISRWWFERHVEDSERDTTVALKLSFNFPQELRVTVLGEGKLSMPLLDSALEDLASMSAENRIGGSHLLGRLACRGFEISAAVAGLAHALHDPDRRVRANAAWALGEAAAAGQDISLARDGLEKATFDSDALTRVNAAYALMAHYSSHGDTEGEKALLGHKSPEVRSCARGYRSEKKALLPK